MNCVYKIVCKDPTITEFYIGSTKNLNRRKTTHKSYSLNLGGKEYCYPIYMFINVNGGWNNWEIVVLKEYKFITKKELLLKEQYFMDKLKPTLNYKNAKGWNMEQRKYHNNRKEKCPICNTEMIKRSIPRHIKRKH